MSAEPVIYSPGRVLVADGVVYVRELEEHDAEVVRIVAESDDPVAATSQCLRVGARALRAAHVTVDVDVIERSFSDLEAPLRGPGHRRGRRDRPHAPPGCSTRTTARSPARSPRSTTSFEQLLGDTFDADSKSSVLAKIEELVLGDDEGPHHARDRRQPDRPAASKELVDTVQREVSDVAEEVRRVTEHLGILDATEEVYEQTTAQGLRLRGPRRRVRRHARRRLRRPRRARPAHAVGLERVEGRRRGRHAQPRRHPRDRGALHPRGEEPHAQHAQDDGRARRGARATATRSPRSRCSARRSRRRPSVPFQYNDDKAIVVLDPDDEDDSALRLAYMWARWTVRRRLAASERGRVSTSSGSRCLLEDAARALERHTAIKRFHTQAKKSIDQAAEQVRDLVGEVHESLDALDADLRGPKPTDAAQGAGSGLAFSLAGLRGVPCDASDGASHPARATPAHRRLRSRWCRARAAR